MNREPGRRPRIFYGWWVLTAATASQALYAALYFMGFGAFFLPVAGELGVSRTALSGVFSLARVQTGILGPFEGWLVDRVGPRSIMLVGIAMLGTGFMLLSLTNNLIMFYVVFIPLMAVGASFGFGPPVAAAVANWFSRRRSLAFGIYLSGTGVGSLLVPSIALLIHSFGWRGASIALAFVSWGCGVPIALTMRHRPEKYGMLPDGDTAASVAEPRKKPRKPPPDDFTLGEAVRTRAFWIMGVSFSMRAIVFSAIGVHFIPAVQDKGFSATQAGSFVALVGVTSIAGRLAGGWLGDRLDNRYMVSVFFMAYSVAAIIFANAGSAWMIVLYAAIFGPADGGMITNSLTMRSDYFGRKAFATIGGAMSMIQTVGIVIGPLMAGFIFDVSGSYRLAFYIFSVMTLIGGALILLVRKPSLPAKKAA